MDTAQIQAEKDVSVLKVRLASEDVRKKERRLIKRQIARLELIQPVVEVVKKKRNRKPKEVPTNDNA